MKMPIYDLNMDMEKKIKEVIGEEEYRRYSDQTKRLLLYYHRLCQEEYDRIIKILKTKRQALNISQGEIAQKCGISVSNVSAIERGVQCCATTTLIGFMNALDLDFNDLSKNQKSRQNQDTILPELKKLLQNMDEDHQQKLITIIKTCF